MASPSEPLLSVVIVAWNVPEVLEACLLALRDCRLNDHDFEIIVVDNASTDSMAPVASRHPKVHWMKLPHRVGYSAANNLGASVASGRYLALLNPDTIPAPDSLPKLVEFLEAHPGHGAVGPLLRLPGGKVQLEGGRRFPKLFDEVLGALSCGRFDPLRSVRSSYLMPEWDHCTSRDVDVLLGACLVLRRDLFERLGGLDEGYALCGEDVDLCRRIREAGLEIRYHAEVEVIHARGASMRTAVVHSQVESVRSVGRYYATYGGRAARIGYLLIVRCVLFPKLVALSFWRCLRRLRAPGESLRANLAACVELLAPLPGPARR